MARNTVKNAERLLDRFFREAEGKTNRQIDVYFVLEDMSVPRDKADLWMDFLVSRGLVNAFGPDVAFLTDKGVSAVIDEANLQDMPKEVRDFAQADPPSGATQESDEPVTREELPRPATPRLSYVDDSKEERLIELEWVCGIGRDPGNTIQVNDKRASRRHAELRFEGGVYLVRDLQSGNGTLVNDDFIDTHRLEHGDLLVIGRTTLRYECPTIIPVPSGDPPDESDDDGVEAIIEPTADIRDHSGIRVVPGRPARPPQASAPQGGAEALFEAPEAPSPSENADLFTEEEGAEEPDTPATALAEDQGATTAPSERPGFDEALDQDDTIQPGAAHSLEVPRQDPWEEVTPQEGQPAGAAAHPSEQAPVVTLTPDPDEAVRPSDPDEGEDPPTVVLRAPVIPPSSPDTAPPIRAPSTLSADDQPDDGSVPPDPAEDEEAEPPSVLESLDGESMPLATIDLADATPSPGADEKADAHPHGFFEVLAMLKQKAKEADLPGRDRHALMRALDVVQHHPLVQDLLSDL